MFCGLKSIRIRCKDRNQEGSEPRRELPKGHGLTWYLNCSGVVV